MPSASAPTLTAADLTDDELKLLRHPLAADVLIPLLNEGGTTFEFFDCSVPFALDVLAMDLAQRLGGREPCDLVVVAQSRWIGERLVRKVRENATGLRNYVVHPNVTETSVLRIHLPGERTSRTLVAINEHDEPRHRGLSATCIIILEQNT